MTIASKRVRITADGIVEFVYDDDLSAALATLPATSTIVRASHVEPCADGIHWSADMSPVGGPVLTGFVSRAAALDAERAWLREHKGL